MKALIVFSHLRWGFVYQRPQHLMSALAEQMRVVYVEEPVHALGPPRLECRTLGPNLQVLVPHTPLRADGFQDHQLPVLRRLLDAHLRARDIDDIAVWFCTPMALPLIANWQPRMVVYDCMDEATSQAGAPALLQQRETELLERADLVLTSGPSLYEAKRALHANVHYLPSTVDADHFAPREQPLHDAEATEAMRLMRPIARPRLGFFGIIDPRVDLELVDAVAAGRADWQLVMVGPLVKVARHAVPRRPNIHWLGRQPYQRLPHLLAQWDVGLMPFKLGGATRFVNPSKTLEYMAGEKAVVATPLPDVVSLYGDLVRIARQPTEFIDACAAALVETQWQRSERLVRAATAVYRSSWREHARQVLRLLAEPVPRDGGTSRRPSHVARGRVALSGGSVRW